MAKGNTQHLLCIQCAMEALVASRPPLTFDQTPEAHLASHHPDPEATQRRRRELEAIIAEHGLWGSGMSGPHGTGGQP